jgi:cell division septum initiation protein DivIVA
MEGRGNCPKENIMSTRVDQFCDKLRDRLDTIETQLESVKTQIHALTERVREGLRSKLEQARTKLEAQKRRVEESRAHFKSQLQLPAEILVESVIWPTVKPTVVERHAGVDAADAQTAAIIDRAVAGIDDVGDAMLYAAVARCHGSAG